jgi:NADPH-dependent glutamate synthase beta subunit-like oxidoreductase/NAD-dependent dihydropyrimidine dehydrogenase PreA subunit
MLSITINGRECEAREGTTVLSAAADNRIYVPSICHHPDLPTFHGLPVAPHVFRGSGEYEAQPLTDEEMHRLEGCGLCVVEIDGTPEPVRACRTPVSQGMAVSTDSDLLRELRRNSLMKILSRHPHACLTCAQREGCSLADCSSNVPKEERCCAKFHTCELRKVAEYVGIKEETARYRPTGLPILSDEPLFTRDFNLCIDCTRCVRVCNSVRGVEALGLVHNSGRLLVGSMAPTLRESGCKFCGACVEVCPTGCLMDKGAQTGEKERRLVPCVHTCPGHVDVPEYIRRIANGDFCGAAAVVCRAVPFANVLGHICFHACESECRRGQIDDPIAICALKRFAIQSDNVGLLRDAIKTPETGRKVGIVGAGPAGLTAAFFLRLKGHSVTAFEAGDRPGGMPALAVPTFRLSSSALEQDLAIIREAGVEIKTGQRLGDGHAVRDLLHQGFDAVMVAVGLPNSKKIAVAGSEIEGVFWGLDFLTDVKAERTPHLGENVVVVGGGNVAIDVAMTALRLSGGTVRLFCLESREEMPAYAQEIRKAEEEGIETNPSWGPVAIMGEHGQVSAVEFRRCVSVFDQQGNFAPTFDDRQRTTVNAGAVILAVGQSPPADIPAEQDGVFLAGDVVGGEMSVIHAVSSGRSAAERIDRYLGGDGDVSLRLAEHSSAKAWIGREEGFVPRPHVPFPCAYPSERRTDFREIEGVYTAQEAIAEAKRCLQCDLRLMIAECLLPPERWTEFCQLTVRQVPTVEGVFVLADAQKKTIAIKGTMDIRAGLLEKLQSESTARYFFWEEDRMYTKRESELIQQHLTRYGALPGGGSDELDDLF